MEELVSTKRTYLGPESWALRVRAARITGTVAAEGSRVRLIQAHHMAAAVAAGRRRSGPSGKSGKLGKFKKHQRQAGGDACGNTHGKAHAQQAAEPVAAFGAAEYTAEAGTATEDG